MNTIFLSLLIGCGWADPPDADAESLYTAELAPPINSGLKPEEPSRFSRWFRLGSLHRWLNAHPEARPQHAVLEDYLRAHPEARTEAAWAQVQQDVGTKAPLVAEVTASPWRLVIVVDQSYSTAPDRQEARAGVEAGARKAGIPLVQVADRGTSTVRVQRDGVILLEVPLSAAPETTGWLVVQEGKPPQWIPQDIASTALGDIGEYFGVPLQ